MFPVFIDIKVKKCLVIGGGEVALRKVETLSKFCDNIVVIAPRILPQIELIANNIIKREFQISDINAFIVIAATDNKALNEEIVLYCNKNNILVNSATKTSGETFSFPAIVKEGNVTIGINSGGIPSLSKKLKEIIKKSLPKNLKSVARSLKDERNNLMRKSEKSLKNKMEKLTEAAIYED